MYLAITSKSFKVFFGISLFVHGLFLGVFIYLAVKYPFFWGGGLSGQSEVVMVDLTPLGADVHLAEVSEGKKIGKKEETGKATAVTKPGFGEGDSPTPAGGKGSGFDAVSGQNRAPDVLALIRQRIIRAKSYPLVARRRGIEGTVKILFRIGKEGGLDKVAVVASSGSDLLDQEAVATVKRGAPYPYYEGDISMGLKFDLRED